MILLSLSQLPFIQLILLSVTNVKNEFSDLIKSNELTISKYEEKFNKINTVYYSVGDKDLKILNGELDSCKDEKFDEKFDENSQISVLDMQTINHIVPDYFIMDGIDPYINREEHNIKKVSINQFLEKIRILLVHHLIFYSQPDYKITGELVYYEYRLIKRFIKLFEHSFLIDSLSIYQSALEQEDYFDSLTNRWMKLSSIVIKHLIMIL